MLFMVEMVAQVVVSVMFHDLLKPVNRSVARISAIIGLVGAGIKTMARLFYYTPLILLSGIPATHSRRAVADRRAGVADVPLATVGISAVHGRRTVRDRRSDRDSRLAHHSRSG